MLQAFLIQRALPLASALLGGYGVFCVIRSCESTEGRALVLLGAALALSYFCRRP
jgi:hypothetical protein